MVCHLALLGKKQPGLPVHQHGGKPERVQGIGNWPNLDPLLNSQVHMTSHKRAHHFWIGSNKIKYCLTSLAGIKHCAVRRMTHIQKLSCMSSCASPLTRCEEKKMQHFSLQSLFSQNQYPALYDGRAVGSSKHGTGLQARMIVLMQDHPRYLLPHGSKDGLPKRVAHHQ